MRALLPLILLVACNKSEPVAAPAATPATAEAPKAAAPVAGGLSGTVEELLSAPGYTYLRLKTAEGEKWAAVPEAQLTIGQSVTLERPMVMKNFQSKTLNRTFDEILFAKLAEGAPSKIGSINPDLIAPGAAAAPAMSPHADAAAPVAEVQKGIAKAELTVAETFAKAKSLSGKPTSVRGQVVKYNAGIMGKNWLHLRDGSGTDAGKNNDLTVTTMDEVAVGDVILVTGTVTADKDFGAGYAYPVVIEDAKVTK